MTRRLCPRWRASRLSLSLSWVLSRWMDRKLCREKRRTTPRRMAMVIFRVRRIDDQRCWRAKRVEKATRKRVVLILLLRERAVKGSAIRSLNRGERVTGC
jgi:hypothetical protein